MNHLGLGMIKNSEGIPDLAISDNNLVFVNRSEAIAQHVKQRLETFESEWFLDSRAGVPWLKDILAQKYNPALAESLIKSEILNTHGVREITSFSVRFDLNTRKLSAYSITILTVYDEEVTV